MQLNSSGLQFGDWFALKRIGKIIRENAFKQQQKRNPG